MIDPPPRCASPAGSLLSSSEGIPSQCINNLKGRLLFWFGRREKASDKFTGEHKLDESTFRRSHCTWQHSREVWPQQVKEKVLYYWSRVTGWSVSTGDNVHWPPMLLETTEKFIGRIQWSLLQHLVQKCKKNLVKNLVCMSDLHCTLSMHFIKETHKCFYIIPKTPTKQNLVFGVKLERTAL